VVALVAVVAVGAGAYAMARADDPAPAAGAGGTASEGPFAVTVTKTECGVPAVGPEDLRQPAKGQFCLVSVSVKNTGGEAALLDGGAQQATDGEGRIYPVADQASVFLNTGAPSLLDEVPPGATVRGVLPFDVPQGVRLSALTVHESMGSRGVSVPLS
jgi:hypothetical protein